MIYEGEDIVNPEWGSCGRVHNWKNYAPDDLKAIWHTFSKEQLIVLVETFDTIASNEVWE
jgi:hypothetical protein